MADENLDRIVERENQGALDAGVTGIEDVGSTRQPEQHSEQQAPAERAEEPVVKIGSKFNDKRAEIARKFREERDSRNGEESLEIVPAEREKTFFGEGVETRQDRIDRQREARGEPPQSAQSAVRTLKVNGRDIQVSEEDLVKHASRALAGDDYMDIAKRARDEANTLLGELREKSRTAISGDQPQPAPQAEDATTETAAILDGIDLDQLADRIQLGERGDAKAALAELATGIIQTVRGNLDSDVTEVVSRNDENRRRVNEATAAIQEFGKANPTLTTKAAQAALAVESLDIMRDAMRVNGLSDEFVESLKRDYGYDEAKATRYCYEQMEKLGHKLPSRKDILNRAGESVKRQFGITEQRQQPSDLRVPANREVRKEQITSQPRRALMPSTLERGERDRDQVRRDAVAQMRESRGKRR